MAVCYPVRLGPADHTNATVSRLTYFYFERLEIAFALDGS